MNQRVAALIPIGCAVLVLFWPLYYLASAVGVDWSYFDSLSLLVRSIILEYGHVPLHDPWTFGGSDIAANPQSRIFSPFLLLDILCLPHIANVVSLAIYASLGAFGFSRLLRHLGRSYAMSYAGALLYVGGTWFMLHFMIGHIPFGSIQLLPWVFLACMRIDEPKAQLGLVGLLALFVVDGGMYAFIFSIYTAVALAAFGFVPLKQLAVSARARPWFLPALAVTFIALVTAKVTAVLMYLGISEIRAEHFILLPLDTLHSFFDPDQRLERHLDSTPWEMHELGCYLGYAAALVVVFGLTQRDVRRTQWRWLAFAALFIWIGTDWLYPVNPWFILTKIPIVRNAHVQTRLFLFAYVGWIIFVTAALEAMPRKARLAATLVVVGEILGVSQYHWYMNFQGPNNEYRFNLTRALITTHEWKKTVRQCWKPGIYRTEGFGCWETYDPVIPPRGATYDESPDYRGEIYLTSGTGTATLTDVSPSTIGLRYDGAGPAAIAVNQNYLFGWDVASGDAMVRNEDLHIAVDVQRSGDVVLRYHPRYWPTVMYVYIAGLLAFAALAFTVVKRES